MSKRNILIVSTITAVIIVYVYLLIEKSKISQPSNNPVTTKSAVITQSEWKTYQNKEVGISFQYPDIFKRVDIRVSRGDNGYIFSGVLEFSQNHWISFGGVTKDYTAPKGGSLIDTYGYEKRGDKYAAKFVWGDEPVTPNEFWSVDNNKEQAIVVRNMELGQVLSAKDIAVFVNIPNSTFPGMVFNVTPPVTGGSLDEKDIALLRQIVSSITFN